MNTQPGRIRAIETRYAGCRFRSRLEVRWAVFFDAMGIGWEYEPEGFIVGDRPYLPDFRLTASGTWIEVKGDEDQLDKKLMTDAVLALPGDARPILLIVGPIPRFKGDWAWTGLCGPYDQADEPVVFDGHWSFIGDYGGTKPLGWASTGTAPAYTTGDSWLTPVTDMRNNAFHDRADKAYTAARSARFEHGETGR